MTEVITDTGPILHLNEINYLRVLTLFGQIKLPDLVADDFSYQLSVISLGVSLHS